MQLTAEHIRYAKPLQLATLTGLDASSFSAWTNTRYMSGQMQEKLATLLGMEKLEFIRGFEARRRDARTIKEFQAELDKIVELRQRVVVA
jgi:hypothetical protein